MKKWNFSKRYRKQEVGEDTLQMEMRVIKTSWFFNIVTQVKAAKSKFCEGIH
jgi:hypothetical protein